MKRPFETWILYLLLMLLSANAFYGGISLILAPDGSLLGMNTGWLEKSPFSSFLVPGILLTLFMGIFPLVALFGLLTKNQNPFFHILNIYPENHWGWTYSLYCGITTIFWIIVQQMLTEYFILQPIIAGVGLFIIIFTLMPRVQKYFQNQNIKKNIYEFE
jgi:hypothetical protein